MRFPRGIRGEFRTHCINFSRNGKREPPRSRAVRGQKWGNGGATGRTNKHFTLKENPLKRTDLDDFVSCYFGGTSSVSSKKKAGTEASPPNRFDRKESDRFKSFSYEDLTKRDKPSLPCEVPGFPRHAQSLGASRRKAGTLPALSLDIFWLKGESLEDSANLPDPDIIAQEIVEDLEAALSQFAMIVADLKK